MKQVLFFMKQLHRLEGSVIYTNQIGMAAMSLLQGVGVFLLIPLISLTGVFHLNTTYSTKFSFFIKWFHGFPPTIGLIFILIIYVVLMLGQNLFQKYQFVLNMRIQQRFIRQLKDEIYQAILESDWNFFTHNRKSDLTNLIIVEVSRVGAGTNSFLQFLSSLIFTMVQLGIALFISVKMTLFVVFFGGILLICSRTFIRKSNSLGKETVELSRTYFAGVTDHLNGIKDIKSNSLESSHLDWFKSISRKIENNIVEITRIRKSSQLVYNSASSILIALFLFLSIQLFKAQPTQLMLVIVIFSRLWPKMTSIQTNLEQISSNLPSFKAIIELQKECEESREFKNEIARGQINPLSLSKGIECCRVSFRYDTDRNQYALKDINLQFPAKRMTAVVGRSGAGKSTLIDILMGLHRPQQGEVLVDGQLLDENLLLSLRKSISYVPQDPFVFNRSIRENLEIVKSNANDDELWEALEFASADEFVKKLPNQLETIVGDRGIKLSGGERQRLVLARAILKKPSILILDEATSSLDTENESNIQQALERLNGNLTLIVIAHRLSTIRNADQVVVLEEGKVAQIGHYKQLAQEKVGVFGQLLAKQSELKFTP